MVKCRRFDRLLMGYFDHGLTPLEQALLDRHLEGCPRCRAARGDLSGILGVLETGMDVFRLSQGLTELRLSNAQCSAGRAGSGLLAGVLCRIVNRCA